MSTVMLGSQVCVEQAGMLSWSFYMLNGNHSPTRAAITSLRGRRGERRRFVAPQSRHQSKNAVNHVPKTVRPRRWLQPPWGQTKVTRDLGGISERHRYMADQPFRRSGDNPRDPALSVGFSASPTWPCTWHAGQNGPQDMAHPRALRAKAAHFERHCRAPSVTVAC